MQSKLKYKKEFIQKFLTTSKNTESNTLKINNNSNNIFPIKIVITNPSEKPSTLKEKTNKTLNLNDPLLLLNNPKENSKTQNNKKTNYFTLKERQLLSKIQNDNKNNASHNKSNSNKLIKPLKTNMNQKRHDTKKSFKSVKVFINKHFTIYRVFNQKYQN